LNELALFAGAGGGILGGQLLGWRTVCAVEWEPYAACVLAARQNDGLLPSFPIWDDVQTFDGRPWRGIVDVVSGGFPCQDISIAGKGDGLDGERSGMWREMARIICEVGPRFVFVENSPMLTSRGLGTVLGDLSSMGFDAKWGIVGAKDVGANHQRDRIWIRGEATNTASIGLQKQANERILESQGGSQLLSKQPRDSGDLDKTTRTRVFPNANSNGCTSSTQSRSIGASISEQPKGQDNSLNSEGASGLSTAKGDVSYSSQLFSNGINDNSRVSMGREAQPQLGDDCGQENVPDSECLGWQEGSNECRIDGKEDSPSISSKCSSSTGEGEVSDSMCDRLQGCRTDGSTERQIGLRCREGRNEEQNIYGADSSWWAIEPDLGRVAHGVDARVDRLKAIGNGQVPLCAATAWGLLK
jgi:site-specific DNA-cytosine methylase